MLTSEMPMALSSLRPIDGPRAEAALGVHIRGESARHERRSAKRRVLGVVRCGQQFDTRSVR